ncbi:hypothetical protein CRT60_08680 [Azospirillum palustre]|uniref:Uncharacterized protein n=1 Tax=Azospirillum palustre TaxID=2044885 RepID=A0A2B8BKF6_9PROT|nr:hypothetical protein [Azospirillum palustre]PGH58023.1 hypothetical protein CRT60_08680 [Azospirillum palustre]
MSAPDIVELGRQWNDARLAFDIAIGALDDHGAAVEAQIPWPFVSHGKRGTVYMSPAEIDRDNRLSQKTKDRLKARLEHTVAAHNEARHRLGLAAMETVLNEASNEVGRLGHAIADDRSATLPAIVTKLEVLKVEVQDGGDMSGYAGGLLASALSDAKAMSAGPADDLAALHREWSDIADWLDGYHYGRRDDRYRYPDIVSHQWHLESQIADRPDSSLAAAVIRMDVALGTFVGSVLCGELEMLEEGAITGGALALEALRASAPHVECWTLKARQRGMERLAAMRAKEAQAELVGEMA